MRTTLTALLAARPALLADGATGTNYFQMGLTSGEPPELWNVEHPERVIKLHQQFVDAGADIILTNSFGGTAHRLKLHHAQDRVHELNRRAAEIARSVADGAERPVVVAGSVGPTGELFEPLGALTEEVAVASFLAQIEGLRDGGADVIWIETMSAIEEVRAAATAAARAGMPFVATCSFDTAGRTMMGLLPDALPSVFAGLPAAPVAIGANCGVGASDILVTVLEITGTGCDHVVVSKGNCGVPRFVGTDVVYSGTPALMADYARLAIDAGARIVGGCCGTSPEHLAAMRRAIDEHCAATPCGRPSHEAIIERIGPLANAAPTAGVPGEGRDRRRRRG